MFLDSAFFFPIFIAPAIEVVRARTELEMCIRDRVYAELLPWDAPEDAVLARNPEGFILSGGLHSSRVEDLPALPGYVLESGFPILAIGDGSHVLVRALGGEVKVADERKYELAELKIISPSRLLYEGDHPQVWMPSGAVSYTHLDVYKRQGGSPGKKVR